MIDPPGGRIAPGGAGLLGARHLARGADLARGRGVAALADAVGDEVADVLPADADGDAGAGADGADAEHARAVRHHGEVARELARRGVRVALGPPKVAVAAARQLVHLRRDHLAVADERRVVRAVVVDGARAAPAGRAPLVRRRRAPVAEGGEDGDVVGGPRRQALGLFRRLQRGGVAIYSDAALEDRVVVRVRADGRRRARRDCPDVYRKGRGHCDLERQNGQGPG